MTFVIVFLVLLIPFHVGLYKLFEKAGRKGWEALVPFYNAWVWLKITDRPWYWIISLPFPGINLITFYAMIVALYKAFGQNKTQDLTLGVIGFAYFTPKFGFDPKVVYVPKENRPVQKKNKIREWLEAAVFAIVAASIIKGYFIEAYKIPTPSMEEHLLVGDFLFVSKLNYGTRIPNTPLSFPFVHNSLPGLPTTKSYLEIWEIPYMRLPALQKIKRNDIVVFNFPVNDTTINDPVLKAFDYYNQVIDVAYIFKERDENSRQPLKSWDNYMQQARAYHAQTYNIISRPLDKKENFIKRCVAIPGDKLEIRDGIMYINDEIAERPPHVAYSYNVKLDNNSAFSEKQLREYGIVQDDWMQQDQRGKYRMLPPTEPGYSYLMIMTDEQVNIIKSLPGVLDVKLNVDIYDSTYKNVKLFPNDPSFLWTRDNYGPITMPKKGDVVNLTLENLPLYRRIIAAYEHNTLDIKDGKILVNGVETSSYTIQQDYYYLVGDNRHNSLDSRYWGYVPHDHVVGKALFIWMSTDDKGPKGFPANIRWNRLFRLVH